MKTTMIASALFWAVAASAPMAQPMEAPGKVDPARVAPGEYKVDSNHTQVAFTINHLGFNDYHGLFGNPTGTLTLDPMSLSTAKVAIEIPLTKVVTTSDGLNKHLQAPDLLDTAKFPTATFKSTKVVADGNAAKISGDLTLHGVTKPVVLDARFSGAGVNGMTKAATVGFQATLTIKRSDFGIAAFLPAVADEVRLEISAAFEKGQLSKPTANPLSMTQSEV